MSWIHYFAYGSNMLQQRLRARVPSATVLATGCLEGRCLDFGKAGRDGSGKCDVPIAAQVDVRTWGVVYAIRRSEMALLDQIEGTPDHYARTAVAVQVEDRTHDVETYVARRRGNDLRPFDWYHALVIAGARQNRLPEDYVAFLGAHVCQPDFEVTRRSRRDAEIVLRSIGYYVESNRRSPACDR